MVSDVTTRWRLYGTLAVAVAVALLLVAVIALVLGHAPAPTDADGPFLAGASRRPFRW